MKNLLTLALCLFCSCGTLINKDGTPTQRLQTLSYLAAYIGTSETLNQHPEWRVGFEKAAADLRILETQPFDVVTVMEIIKRLPVKELRSDRATLYINSATLLLTDNLSTDACTLVEDQKPIITAIRQGIERGLSLK